jgi:hypothetical protein
MKLMSKRGARIRFRFATPTKAKQDCTEANERAFRRFWNAHGGKVNIVQQSLSYTLHAKN